MTVDEKIKKLNGIIAVINTPFTENGEIDLQSVSNYVNYYVEAGVVGFLTTAMASEVNKLTFKERTKIVETVLAENYGRVIVIGGASAKNQKDRLRNAVMLNELGCDGILTSIPFVNESSYIKEVNRICESDPGFLVLQDWDFNGYGIPVETVVKIFESNQYFKSFKIEVVPAGVKYTEMIRATSGKLHLSGGWASNQMIEGLDRGVNAFMSTILPELYYRIYRMHHDGRRKAAKELFNKLVPVLAFSHQHLDISIHFNKRMLHRLGLFSTHQVREPILPFDKYHKRIAEDLIDYSLMLLKSNKYAQ
jgi:4-hydroxy-tetrahydrodipicolinate synthase